MTTLAATHPTLLDFKSRLDPNDNVAKVIEMMAQTNQVNNDAVYIESNELTGHVTSIRTGIPEPAFRKLYGFTQPQKSTSVKVRESLGMAESYAEIDKALADLNGNSAAWRMSEESPFIEGFGQKMARYIFAGNEATEPEAFTGLGPRYNAVSGAMNAENVIVDSSASGGSANSSIWLVCWGPNTVHMIYPKGSKAGLMITDKGQQTLTTSEGNMEIYRTHYRQDIGLVVRDWRYVVRIQLDTADVGDPSSVSSGTSYAGPNLRTLMSKAMRRVPTMDGVRPVFYMNRTMLDAFDVQANRDPLLRFQSQTDAQGKTVETFRGVPVRRVDQITASETAIT